ncbi:calcium-dependent protein kinase 32-like [Papaver somniferum]|uniref:calcium-dependent protein kinase 32-like n=1 Tax=Papaver somniferum TaxID=3469 RepID=UPI000E70364A|nr:calcium-dependent protein kinase 32-like [Papaver somniferum]XP_026444723.1 calcium-dependent protein kinase 32-like [Papaver somniferum]XP_026444724.1 calcium-dependent protein kinase 32-like [Papaver somniferum]XP_026444725.1 calcium-dependent protein kinase 32-like [Papaver somniferum]
MNQFKRKKMKQTQKSGRDHQGMKYGMNLIGKKMKQTQKSGCDQQGRKYVMDLEFFEFCKKKLERPIERLSSMDLEFGRNKDEKLITHSQKPEKLFDGKYLLVCEIGRGAFGIVYYCIDKNTKRAFACKYIPKKPKHPSAVHEISIMANIRHPNVVTLKESRVDEESTQIVMELCEGGDLLNRMVERGLSTPWVVKKSLFSEPIAAHVLKSIMQVVKEFHEHGIMLRDLNPRNFVFVDNRDSSALKAIDFGLSIGFKPGQRFSYRPACTHFLAPEVLIQNYGPEADIWSAGVIMYIMLGGRYPFFAKDEKSLEAQIKYGFVDRITNPWPRVSDSAKNLIRNMLEVDASKRFTAQQVLNHPWLLVNAKKNPTS